MARILSVALITAGVVLIADVAVTLAWKEPISSVYGSMKQDQARSELATVSDEFLASPEINESTPRPADVEAQARRLAGLFAEKLDNGKPIGQIQIPSIGADYTVIQGTDEADLERGPGHYPETSLPGQGRTIAIAGHRTTYLAPFNDIDSIEVDDRIELKMPYGTFTYTVTGTKIVEPTQTGIVRDVGRERLVLTACHPLYSAAQRYAVFADLSDVQLPAGVTGGPDSAQP